MFASTNTLSSAGIWPTVKIRRTYASTKTYLSTTSGCCILLLPVAACYDFRLLHVMTSGCCMMSLPVAACYDFRLLHDVFRPTLAPSSHLYIRCVAVSLIHFRVHVIRINYWWYWWYSNFLVIFEQAYGHILRLLLHLCCIQINICKC